MFTIFFRTSGVVNISYLDNGKTKDYQTYIEVWLKPLVSPLKEQRPLDGRKNLKYHFNARPYVQSIYKRG